MSQHETKACPRCQSPFECKVGNVSQCHCSGIRLTEEERAYLSSHYTDCLCNSCLQASAASTIATSAAFVSGQALVFNPQSGFTHN